MRSILPALTLACLLLPGCRQSPAPGPTAMTVLTRAEAVRADGVSMAPPAQGWAAVPLRDDWSRRWPGYDGVVWYRLRWRQADANAPAGVLLDAITMAALVQVNGSVVYRDPSLAEPLSRSWTAPRYFLVDAPLLHEGENTLLVRVSGLAAYQPGLGVVTVGDPTALQAQFRRVRLFRYDFQLLDQAISLVLAAMFGLFWLLRRKDSTYGWFALTTLLSMGYAYNNTASSPWPFARTDAWEAFNAALLVASAAAEAVFLLRFTGRHWPRTERWLLAATAIVLGLALLFPSVMGPGRNAVLVLGGVIYYTAFAGFLWLAARSRRVDYRVLGLSLLVPVLVSLRDFAVVLGLVDSDIYYLPLTSTLGLLGMGFALAWRFADAMQRVEGFNVELERQVDVATTNLASTLAREHALALANTRIGERLHLVRDLHDGFGGSLLGAIAELEQPQRGQEAAQAATLLKGLRDDLRLVIDTTVHDDLDLAQLLAPLRHQWVRRFDAIGIESRWQLEGLDGVRPGVARSLDVLRLLQEGLTNVFKHSGARRVRIEVACKDGRLRMDVQDDGQGMVDGAATGGAGLASMQGRAARLGGRLVLAPAPDGGTRLRLDAPLVAADP